MGSTNQLIALGRGNFTLDDFRFPFDPDKPKNRGKYIKIPYKVLKTQTADIIQSWNATPGSVDQVYKFRVMNSDFYDQLETRWLATLADGSLTYVFVFHDPKINESWNIKITDLTGDSVADGTVWLKVTLKFRLVSQIII